MSCTWGKTEQYDRSFFWQYANFQLFCVWFFVKYLIIKKKLERINFQNNPDFVREASYSYSLVCRLPDRYIEGPAPPAVHHLLLLPAPGHQAASDVPLGLPVDQVAGRAGYVGLAGAEGQALGFGQQPGQDSQKEWQEARRGGHVGNRPSCANYTPWQNTVTPICRAPAF